MKKILLTTAIALMMGTSVSAQSVATATEVHPLQITAMEEGKIPTLEFNTKRDSLIYSDHYIDTLCLFHRCMSDTMLVGYALVPTDIDTLSLSFWVNHYGFKRFKSQITINDVQQAEIALLKLQRSKELRRKFSFIINEADIYGRQYLFFYNKDGDECVFINCSCEKYDWLFSRVFCKVLDGGDCYWKMAINLTKDKVIDYSINGPTNRVCD